MQKVNLTVIGIFKKILFYFILFLIWEAIYRIFVENLQIWKSYTFPSPVEVFKTLFYLFSDNTLPVAVIASIKRLIYGYFISLAFGIIIGLAVVKYKYINENFRSLILGLQTLPSIVWLPFAILWFGLNENAITFVIAIGSTFAIAISTESGIKNINPLYIKAARTMGARRLKLYWNVVLPAVLPYLISGMKQGWSFAWRALMAGEMLIGTKGLGHVLMVGRDLGDIAQVVAVMIVIVILGLIFDKLIFGRIEEDIRYKWGLNAVNK